VIVRTLYTDAPTQIVDVGGTRLAYRQVGVPAGVPVVFLRHWTAVMDGWGPRVIDGIAAKRHVIAFDNRGVGASEGTTPHSVAGMARDAVSLVQALELDRVGSSASRSEASSRRSSRTSTRGSSGSLSSPAPRRATAPSTASLFCGSRHSPRRTDPQGPQATPLSSPAHPTDRPVRERSCGD